MNHYAQKSANQAVSTRGGIESTAQVVSVGDMNNRYYSKNIELQYVELCF